MADYPSIFRRLPWKMEDVIGTPAYIGHWTYVTYVAEGAANVVFKSILYPPEQKPSVFDQTEVDLLTRYLMRVPKQPKSPGRTYFGAQHQYKFLYLIVCPLFNNKLELFVDHVLCRIPQNTVLNMRRTLDAMDKMPPIAQRRPAKFVNDKIDCPGGWIMLVEDMRPATKDGAVERTIEFKPKWLAQSPSAPKNANTCRCCALASKKYHDAGDSRDEKLSPEKYPCPLWLDPDREPTLDGRDKIRRRAIRRLFKGDKHYSYLYAQLKKLPTLRILKQQQLAKDQDGPLHANKYDCDFCLAMTLRDCSLFVRYREKPDGRVDKRTFEAKLADLDEKNAEWKLADWQNTETALVIEGWYNGRGKMINCALRGEQSTGE